MHKLISGGLFVAFFLISCAFTSVTNINDGSMKFAQIRSDFIVSDVNNYGCEKIPKSVLSHILKAGVKVSQREVHGNYSTTGCSVKGSVYVNGIEKKFTYEYGGLVYFDDDLILGCGEDCCSEDYPYCSYDREE